MKATVLLEALVDDGSFRSWDPAPESVVTGEGLLRGRRVAVAAGEFSFLGGSIGVAAGERLTACAERATRERLPLLVAPASGGTRMQEGTIAFLQMVKITAAVTAHKDAGLPYLVYLRHPTTGGVFASWASLGQVTLAEPGALIGFLGPRVYEALEGRPFPPGVQTAETLRDRGLVDAVIPVGELPAHLDRILTALTPEPTPAPFNNIFSPNAPQSSPAWESVCRTRASGRPGAREFLEAAVRDLVPLVQGAAGEGAARGGELILALGRVAGRPCVLAAQDHAGPQTVGALRLARRGMALATELRIPLVTVIDTPGAELSPEAETGGIAQEIAQCMAELISLPVPTVSVLLGQGTGGGALALFPADRVVAAGHAWLAPLAPEGASAIVYKDTAHAPELAERQGIRAADLAAAGAVDRVVPENGEPGDLCRDLGHALSAELTELTGIDDTSRLAKRLRRYRDLGSGHTGLADGT